jgi:hypothetical protein
LGFYTFCDFLGSNLACKVSEELDEKYASSHAVNCYTSNILEYSQTPVCTLGVSFNPQIFVSELLSKPP